MALLRLAVAAASRSERGPGARMPVRRWLPGPILCLAASIGIEVAVEEEAVTSGLSPRGWAAVLAVALASAACPAAAESGPVRFNAKCGSTNLIAQTAAATNPVSNPKGVVQSLGFNSFAVAGNWPADPKYGPHACTITSVSALYNASKKTVDAKLAGGKCTVSVKKDYRSPGKPLGIDVTRVVADATLKTETGLTLTLRMEYTKGAKTGAYTLVGGFPKSPAFEKQVASTSVACE